MSRIILIGICVLLILLVGCQPKYYAIGDRINIMEKHNFTTYIEFNKYVASECNELCEPFKYDITNSCDFYTCKCRG